MKILLTGSRGFIGSKLVAALKKDKTIQLVEVCRENGYDLSKIGWSHLIPFSCDIVLNLAQSAKYKLFPEGSYDMVAVNIQATQELLDWSYRNKVKKFIQFSTGNVYHPQERIITEKDVCVPSSMYAATKLSGEYLSLQYKNIFNVMVARIFGVFGEGQKEGMLIPNIIHRLKTNQEITLASNIGLMMTPLPINDCVDSILNFIKEETNLPFNIFNLAGKHVVSLRDIVDSLSHLLKVEPNIKVVKETPKWFAGGSDYTHLPFVLKTSLEDGLKQMTVI